MENMSIYLRFLFYNGSCLTIDRKGTALVYIFFTLTDLPSHPYNIEEVAVEGRSTTSSSGRPRKRSVKSGLCQVSKFLDGFELGSAYFVNFKELRLKMAI